MKDPDIPWHRSEKELFFEALERHTPQERAAFLDGACGKNPVLRARVASLLADHFHEDTFMKDPAVEVLPDDSSGFPSLSEAPSQIVGRYKLLEKIGEGGFGTVWMAEQMEPVSRRVALKIIKPGMDTREVIARFEAERQALAMMDHPNIARVLDAGATGQGRPFFVMELVRGLPITRYCDEAQLGTRERLALFTDICAAINHAHQKGVIHRDIKPSNVMITLHGDKPVVKVIDFGIAKATQGRLTDKTLFTRFEQFIGTPVYMSPEQASMSGLDVDTRSDIYGLGILLYELLTGIPPFDAKSLASASHEEMQRIIREVDPPRPSSRLSTIAGEERTVIAKARHIEPDRLRSLVEPDLDWIVMKAIEKDRVRRYETASEFARDIQRFLADETVSASPPGTGYKLRKFARRNKTALRLAGSIAAVLLAATAVSIWQAVRATRAEEKSRRNETTAKTEAARANELKRVTEASLINEKAATRRADGEAEGAQQNLYYAQMHLAHQAWHEYRGQQYMRDLLTLWLPPSGSPDRRGWEWFYLNSLPYRNLRTLTESGKGLSTVMWHVASKRLAEGTFDGLIRIWDVEREQTILTVRAPVPWVHYWGSSWFGWSPDGSKLAAGAKDGTVHLWETVSGRETGVFRGHASPVVSLAFSADGRGLASWEVSGAIRVWEVDTGRLTTEVTHSPIVTAGKWSPDNKLFASGHLDGTVTVSGTHAGDRIVTLPAHVDCIYHVEWSPDSTRLASTSANDFFVSIWDVASEKRVLGPLRHSHGITAMAWEPGGQRLATGSIDQTIRIWDTGTGKEAVTLRGSTDGSSSLSWGPDGVLASGELAGCARIWNSVSDDESSVLTAHTGWATAVAWSPDGQRLASAGDDGKVKIWNAANHREVRAFDAQERPPASKLLDLISSLAWNPDGSQVAAAGIDGTVKVLEIATGREVLTLPAGHPAVRSVAWSPNGTWLAAGSEDGTIRLVEWQGDKPKVHAFQAHTGPVRALAWSPGSEQLASGGERDALVKIWDPVRSSEVRQMGASAQSVFGVSWSPDGGRLASAHGARRVIVWDAVTGQKLSTMSGHHDFVRAVAWSPDGTRLASASFDGSVRIWDPLTGKETLVFRNDLWRFYDISWNSDGARLAAACTSGEIWLWDATRGFERDVTPRALPYIDRKVALGTARGEDRRWFADSYVRAGKPAEALAAVKDDGYGLARLARQFAAEGNAPLAAAARTGAIALLEKQRLEEPGNEAPVSELGDLLLLPPNGPPASLEEEQLRIASLNLADPWAKLAAAYHITGDRPALARLLERHPSAVPAPTAPADASGR